MPHDQKSDHDAGKDRPGERQPCRRGRKTAPALERQSCPWQKTRTAELSEFRTKIPESREQLGSLADVFPPEVKHIEKLQEGHLELGQARREQVGDLRKRDEGVLPPGIILRSGELDGATLEQRGPSFEQAVHVGEEHVAKRPYGLLPAHRLGSALETTLQ